MIERSYHYQDQDALIKLWLAHRVATSVEVYPTIWRSRLLLSSRVWESESDTRIWQSTKGQLNAFAMLWRRSQTSPYMILDYCIHPEEITNELFQAVLGWGVQRAQVIANKQNSPLQLFTRELRNFNALPSLEAFGFKPYQTEGQDHNLYFALGLRVAISPPTLPAGYSIRDLQINDELEAYNSLFDFASVDPQHLDEQLTSEEYSHFIVANPEGQFVAYCETSICRNEWRLRNQHIGWIDYIGTHPEDQRQGLGEALLRYSLQKLQKQGADEARLVTISSNLPAIKLYQKAGFHQEDIKEAPSYQITLQPKYGNIRSAS